MSPFPSFPREQSGKWKGGRVIDCSGYVKILVGRSHPSADPRGYVKEHRWVMEKHLGRRLVPAEIVHHIDGDKQNNALANLRVMTVKEHNVHHNTGRRPLGPVQLAILHALASGPKRWAELRNAIPKVGRTSVTSALQKLVRRKLVVGGTETRGPRRGVWTLARQDKETAT